MVSKRKTDNQWAFGERILLQFSSKLLVFPEQCVKISLPFQTQHQSAGAAQAFRHQRTSSTVVPYTGTALPVD